MNIDTGLNVRDYIENLKSIDESLRGDYISEIRAMMSKGLIEAEADLRAEVAFGTMGGERYRSRVVRYVHNDIAQFENYVKDIVV